MSDVVPVDNLFRGRPGGIELRADDPIDLADSTMTGHFAVFDTWTEIDSWFEGRFLERIAPGAFARTINNNADRVVVQFDHGYDLHVGDSPLGVIDVLREDEVGAYYEVPLLDTDYNRDRILPMLRGQLMNGDRRGSVLGASFRFRVTRDEWTRDPDPSDDNPEGLDERTIREVRLYEFGPVVFPAYPEATAEAASGRPRLRSLTDHYLDRQRAARSRPRDTGAPGPATAPVTTDAPAEGHPADQRRRYTASDARNLIALTKEQIR